MILVKIDPVLKQLSISCDCWHWLNARDLFKTIADAIEFHGDRLTYQNGGSENSLHEIADKILGELPKADGLLAVLRSQGG